MKAVAVIVGLLGLAFFTFALTLFILFVHGPGFYAGFVIVAGLALGGLLVVNITGKWTGRKRLVITVTAAALFLSVFVLYEVYEAMRTDKTIAERGIELETFEPFTDSAELATLEEAADFRFESKEEALHLDGATALYPVYSAFTEAVYPEGDYPPHDQTKSKVVSTQTGRAYDRLLAGDADLIFAAGPSDSQLASAERMGIELVMTPIGREGFVFFVHEDHPVEDLSVDEVRDIYSGVVTNWEELGGEDEPIRAFQRPDDSGSQTALEGIMGDRRLMTPPEEDVPGGMGSIITETADYRNALDAIGFSFRYFSTELVEDRGIKHLSIEGVYPDETTIRSGDYPFTDSFYAIYTDEKKQEVQPFVDWIHSEQGQTLIEESGYTGIRD